MQNVCDGTIIDSKQVHKNDLAEDKNVAELELCRGKEVSAGWIVDTFMP